MFIAVVTVRYYKYVTKYRKSYKMCHIGYFIRSLRGYGVVSQNTTSCKLNKLQHLMG